MQKITFSFICFFLFCFIADAQDEQRVRMLSGKIVDFVSNEPVADTTFLYVLRSDSSAISAGAVFPHYNGRSFESHFTAKVEKPGNYILKFENKHYQTYYFPISVFFHKREKTIYLGNIPLKRHWINALNEVEVVSTKIKFYFNKDTLVYNADGFITQPGFVLTEILKKMPGLVINSNGEIDVNGRKVQSLLLNGKDFFNADRRTLIENLPAMMVNSVKFYEKKPDTLSVYKREREFSGYVMDVKLKKEYEAFSMGNAEFACGTDSRYYSKLFGMKFNQIARLSSYAISNNINKDEHVDRNGNTQDHSNGNGDNKFSKVGFAYNLDQPRGYYSLSGNASFDYRDKHIIKKEAGENFYEKGNTFRRRMTNNKEYSLSARTSHSFYLFGNTKWDFSLLPYLYYERYKGKENSIQSYFKADVDDMWGESWIDSLMSEELTQTMKNYGITRESFRHRNEGNALRTGTRFSKEMTIPHTEDRLRLYGAYNYHYTDNDIFTRQDIDNYSDKSNCINHIYTNMSSHDDQEEVKVSYTYQFVDFNSINFSYDYQHMAFTDRHPCYSLHKLVGWDTKNHGSIDLLPSQEELLNVFDTYNSYNYTQHDNIQNIELKYLYQKHNEHIQTDFSITIPFYIEDRELLFHQISNDTLIHKRKVWPDFKTEYRSFRTTENYDYVMYSLQYEREERMPTLFSLVNIQNSTNPLFIMHGNPELKNNTVHHFFGQFFWQNCRGYVERFDLSYYNYQNQISNACLYDRKTGITEYTPCNINGNKRIVLNVGNSLFVRKDRLASLDNNLVLTWLTNADYATDKISVMKKRTVNNFTVLEKINFKGSNKSTKFHSDGNLFVQYTNSRSEMNDIPTIEVWQYGAQLFCNYELPYSMNLQNNVVVSGRRGYNASDMNDTEFLWIVKLSKKYGERYALHLECYDILNQRKTMYHYLNGQGRTDTFCNNMKRYFMLHFVMRLNSPNYRR